MTTRVRPLERTDLTRVVALLEAANLGGASANLARYLLWQPQCGWVAEQGDELVGSVTVLRQGDVGFVGAMAVIPAQQGQGLGRRLLEHAQAAGRAAGLRGFLLEATPAGEPLYRRLGYVAIGETLIAARAPTGPATAAPLADAELPALVTFDRAATGLERADMIAGLVGERHPGAIIRRAGAGGSTDSPTLAGFGLAISDRLGPILAHDPGAGRALVEQLVAPCTVVAAPMENAHALRALADHGYGAVRTLRRMALDISAPPMREQIWALTSPGAG